MKLLLAVCITASLFLLANANLYQTCSLSLAKPGYNYTHAEVGSLHLPYSEKPYSFAVNATSTLFFNVCGGSAHCNGALACLVSDTGVVSPIVYANENPQYDSWFPNSVTEQLEHKYSGENGRMYTYFDCDPSTPFTVTRASGHMDDDDYHINVYVNTSAVCTQRQLAAYNPPAQFDNLSGDIYMAGQLPMFSFDYVASADGYSMFEGKFYYSRSMGSIKLNGTLSNRQGQTSQVGYIVQSSSNEYDDPPLSVSYVKLATLPNNMCLLLAPLTSNDYSSWAFSPLTDSATSFSPVSFTFYAEEEEKAARKSVFEEAMDEIYWVSPVSPVSPISFSANSPSSFGYDTREASHLDWFSSHLNMYQGPPRNYTSVYFNKGATFEVQSWAGSDARWGDRPFINMMQRTSDGLPIFLGTSLLAPFTPEDDQEFISEVNLDTLNFSTALPASVFTPPAEWKCKL